jgi:hypothetical protein
MKMFSIEQQIWFSSKASPELKSLVPVFTKLLQVHHDYILGEATNDNLYGYGERPHVSLLAAAVWLSGGTALEEYGTHKTKNLRDKPKPGRRDLWIRTKKAAFECEAKRLWLDLEKDAEKLKDKLAKNLCALVKEIGHPEKKNGLALCFAIPGLACKPDQCRTLDKRVYDLTESIKTGSDCDALIWIGFKKGKNPMGKSHLLPGLLLAIKEVKKRRR